MKPVPTMTQGTAVIPSGFRTSARTVMEGGIPMTQCSLTDEQRIRILEDTVRDLMTLVISIEKKLARELSVPLDVPVNTLD